MSTPTIDFTDIDTNGQGNFETVPEGRYEVRVDEAKVKTAQTGREGIGITFDIINDEEFSGQKLFENRWFPKYDSNGNLSDDPDKARTMLSMLKETIQKLAPDYDLDRSIDLEELKQELPLELMGNEARVRVVHEDHWDKDRAAEGEVNEVVDEIYGPPQKETTSESGAPLPD